MTPPQHEVHVAFHSSLIAFHSYAYIVYNYDNCLLPEQCMSIALTISWEHEYCPSHTCSVAIKVYLEITLSYYALCSLLSKKIITVPIASGSSVDVEK